VSVYTQTDNPDTKTHALHIWFTNPQLRDGSTHCHFANPTTSHCNHVLSLLQGTALQAAKKLTPIVVLAGLWKKYVAHKQYDCFHILGHLHLKPVLAQRPRTGYAAQYLSFKKLAESKVNVRLGC
jgi:hypothetical protein